VIDLGNGLVAKVKHFRKEDCPRGPGGLWTRAALRQAGRPIASKGGATVVELYLAGEEPNQMTFVGQGSARCSDRDNYSRRMGRTIALGRALKGTEEG
jgi:hypothetical protein